MARINVYQGSDTIHDLEATDEVGVPLDLTDSTLTFQVRRYPGALLLIEKQTGVGITHAPDQATTGAGKATLTLDAGDTLALAPGRYRWGLWLQDALGNDQPLRERGVFHLRAPIVAEGGS
jgi:hypothetical protein